jgi:hypothetical protein
MELVRDRRAKPMNIPSVSLAEREHFGRVFTCAHGCVHVQIGPVTLSLSPDDYMQFVDLINTSAAHFEDLFHEQR